MRCAEIMKKDVECVSPTDSVQSAACRMRDLGIGFLPVCDDTKRVLGTVTDRDITTRLVASGKESNAPIEDIMTRGIVACRPEDDLENAAHLMQENQKSRVMCVDDTGCLVGVISLSDLAEYDDAEATETLRKVSAREAIA